MNTAKKWAVGGLLAAVFGAANFMPIEKKVTGSLYTAQGEYLNGKFNCYNRIILATNSGGSVFESCGLSLAENDLNVIADHGKAYTITARSNLYTILNDRLSGNDEFMKPTWKATKIEGPR